jgi:hypothetical protein
MSYVIEPSRRIPVIYEADICVIGGSCTGVFAAVRAAKLGARVVLIEQQNAFGGVATNSMVNIWHSLQDTEFEREIIGGLTADILKRLESRDAVIYNKKNLNSGSKFNSEELKIELDKLIQGAGIKVYLHTFFTDVLAEEGRITAVIVENKNGRGAIKAAQFIDASGDGDVATRLGLEMYVANHMQPATTCARFSNWGSLEVDGNEAIGKLGDRFGLQKGFVWGCYVPGSDVYMLAGTRITGINPAIADDLTYGEMEGRRQVRAIMDLLKAASPNSKLSLQALPSRLGLRESRHARCEYQLTGDEVLNGVRFSDAIANGSYRVDIHHQDKPGITFRYLNGEERYCVPGSPPVESRWRAETTTNPTFYQVPLRSLVPRGAKNLMMAGRMLDVDEVAHAAVRVMVNMNQTGEAAGIAAFVALDKGLDVGQVAAGEVRDLLSAGGSIII